MVDARALLADIALDAAIARATRRRGLEPFPAAPARWLDELAPPHAPAGGLCRRLDASSAPATASALPTVSGTGPGEWNDALVAGVAQVCAGSDLGDKRAIGKARAGIAALTGIGPDDVIADLLSAQLVSAHHAAMDCYKRAAGGELPLEVWREALSQANRLSRTSAALIEALNRHRGKGGQQKVVVEHVYVGPGGQAIVGPVVHGGRGEG